MRIVLRIPLGLKKGKLGTLRNPNKNIRTKKKDGIVQEHRKKNS